MIGGSSELINEFEVDHVGLGRSCQDLAMTLTPSDYVNPLLYIPSYSSYLDQDL